MSEEVKNRRPLKLRGWKIIQISAKWMSGQNITPNQISLASIGFSAFAALFLSMVQIASPTMLWAIAVLVPLGLIGRGMCNVIDGMVAVEGGKSTPSGELFNDIPDRIADVLVLVAAGYGAGAPEWGWLAAVLAVMTAYVRTLARGIGAPSDFQGPMSKLPRMTCISIGAILTPIEAFIVAPGYVLCLCLIIIIIGCALTIWNRARAAYLYLEGKADA